MDKTILIVDDEKDIVDLVAYNLEREGFQTVRAYDGHQAMQRITEHAPDMVILDLMLSGIGGLDVCRTLKSEPRTQQIPIIMLTAKSDSVDKITGLEIGADDYITKPFHVRELIARVRAVLRRGEMRPATEHREKVTSGGIAIDFKTYEVTVKGRKVDIGPTELKLLQFFMTNPGRVFTRGQLLDHVWGNDAFVEPRTVDVHISRLRAAIEKDKDNPRHILTVRGIGYKFVEIKEI